MDFIELSRDVSPGGEGDVVRGYFARNGSFVIDNQYLAGKDNPYWDSDEFDSFILLDAANAGKVIELLNTSIEQLPESLKELFTKMRFNGLVNLLKEQGIQFQYRSLTPYEIIDGAMNQLLAEWEDSNA